MVFYFIRHRKRFAWYHWAWLGVVAFIYAKQTWHLKSQSPTEALHFVQYGVMYILFLRALLHRTHDGVVFVSALCLTSVCGNLDEIVQWLTPRRYFDWRDVGLNAFSGTMMGLLFLGALRPVYLKGRPAARSVWQLVRLGLLHATVSMGCMMNTPVRTAWLVETFPFLERWSDRWGEMTEYGYVYHDPQIGSWKSRLPPDELMHFDKQHGQDVAAYSSCSPYLR